MPGTQDTGFAIVPDQTPEGWAVATLGDGFIEDLQPGFACGVHNREGAGVPHLRPMNVNTDGRIDLDTLKYISAAAAEKAGKWLQRGDILFNNTNSAELVGKTALYDLNESFPFSNHMTRVRIREGGLNPHFCALLLHANWLSGDFQDRCNQHVSQASVGRETLLQTPIPVPPFAEQKRIASAVEALRARIDNVRERLARVIEDRKEGDRDIPSIFKRFRQSVLAAACAGQLTTHHREDRADVHPPCVRDVCDVRDVDLDELRRPADIPETWTWGRLGACLEDLRYGTSVKCTFEGEGVPVLRVPNIASGQLDLDELKYGPLTTRQLESLRLRQGDVIVCRTNGSLDLVGKAAVFGNLPGDYAFASYLIRLRTDSSTLLPDYLHLVLSAPIGRDQIEQRASTTAGQYNLNREILRNTLLPIPSLREQRELVDAASALLAIADRLEKRVILARECAEQLTSGILRRAYLGELVPTESELASASGTSFESGEQLLVRIKAEAAVAPSKTGRGVATKKTRPRSKKAVPKKLTKESVVDTIKEMPRATFSFSELRGRLPGDYDEIKDIVFSLLDDESSGLTQCFDAKSRKMCFKRSRS